MDSPQLEADRNVYLTIDTRQQKEFNGERYLLSTWQEGLYNNIEMMLNYRGADHS